MKKVVKRKESEEKRGVDAVAEYVRNEYREKLNEIYGVGDTKLDNLDDGGADADADDGDDVAGGKDVVDDGQEIDTDPAM